MEHLIFASYGNDSIALIQWAHERGLPDVHVAYGDTGWAAAWAVARAAAWAASWAASSDAARAAAWVEASDASSDASRDASRDAAWAEAWEFQADLLRIVCADIEQR